MAGLLCGACELRVLLRGVADWELRVRRWDGEDMMMGAQGLVHLEIRALRMCVSGDEKRDGNVGITETLATAGSGTRRAGKI